MRNRMMCLTTALVLASAPFARAQDPVLPRQPLASVDIGLRFSDLNGDQARFQRFRDLGDGAFLDRVRFERQGNNWLFEARADHAGRRDQRYVAEYRGSGKIKVSFQWDQVPLFYSRDTRTLYTVEAPGVLRIADDIQQGLAGGQLLLANLTGQARSFDVESRRDTATFNFLYSATRAVDVKVKLKTARREGTMPWGTNFGFNATEVAAPIDTRTTDVATSVEWADQRGSFRIGYDGSWFDNSVQTLNWDSRLAFIDSTSASGQGRTALWPNSTLHGVTSVGSLKLPAHSRATASVTFGTWSQDQALLPFTVNSALPILPLERPTAEAEARTLAMNYTVTSRPSRYVWLNGRFRYYDFDNRTPHFPIAQYVRYDQSFSTPPIEGPEPLGYTRHNFDIDASFTPVSFTALRIGYGRDWTDRTFRIFERTTEDVVRASIDTTQIGWLTLRAIVERGTREGSGFDEHALTGIGEQPAMRHFDIADRDRTRVTGLVQVTPLPALGLSASSAVGRDDYKDSGFGLRDNKNRSYAFTVDVAPADLFAAGVSYTFEKYTAVQNSRNASPGAQFTDPTRDWSIDSADKVHTISGNVDLLELAPKMEIRLAYDFTRSRYSYVYGVPADSTLVAPRQLPPVVNELYTSTADLRYFLTPQLAVGLMYWYDRYLVDDFALGPDTINRLDLPGSLFLGYVYRPYTANSAWLRLLYFW